MTLRQAHRSGLFCALVSTFEAEERDGVILSLTDHWCILASIEAFDPDGYWIIRKDTIKQVRHRPYEAFRHQILQAEGIPAAVKPLNDIDISTTSSLFESLIRYQKYVVIHRETEIEWWTHHAALAGIKGDHLLMHSFDGAGRFNQKFSRCKMADITSIRIGGRYLLAYQKAAPYDFAECRPAT
jgi:hypothetical protein